MTSIKTKNQTARVLSLIILLIFSIFTLAPFVFLLNASFRPGAEMIQNGLSFNTDFANMNLENYKLLYTARDQAYLFWYKNSLLITLIQTVFTLFLSSMVGYGLAMYDFKGKNLLFVLVLVVMMIPVEILILPLYKLTISMKTINTYAGVMLPFVVSSTAIFFFRQYACGLPKELMEAGRIDGSTEFGIFFKIMVPLMRPAYGAMTILVAMGSWNGFVWPLIVLRDTNMQTIPIGLASLITPYGNSYDLLLAGAIMAVVPIIIIFLFNQKSFISGLTIGGVKG